MVNSGMRSLPLSKAAKAAGFSWIMADGVSTDKEARKLERILVEHANKIAQHGRGSPKTEK